MNKKLLKNKYVNFIIEGAVKKGYLSNDNIDEYNKKLYEIMPPKIKEKREIWLESPWLFFWCWFTTSEFGHFIEESTRLYLESEKSHCSEYDMISSGKKCEHKAAKSSVKKRKNGYIENNFILNQIRTPQEWDYLLATLFFPDGYAIYEIEKNIFLKIFSENKIKPMGDKYSDNNFFNINLNEYDFCQDRIKEIDYYRV